MHFGMLRAILIARFLVTAAPHLSAQPLPQFEVATVKPAPPQPVGQVSTHMNWDGHRLNFTGVNLQDMIARAYGVQRYQITGPSWLETERFDVAASFPADSKPDQMPLMLQSLLADRFKLTLHHVSKELPIFALTVAKGGPKIKITESETGINSNSDGVRKHMAAKASMPRLSEFLSREVSRPVTDKTGLNGAYEMTPRLRSR